MPYDPASPEVLTPQEAATIVGRSTSSIRRIVEVHHIGRKITPGCLRISRVALAMVIDDDRPALEAYLAGQRDGIVAAYFRRFNIEVS